MKITVETIDHKDQRYPTVGDWQWSTMPDTQEPILTIRISSMGSMFYEALVAVHEIVEAILARRNGVSEQDLDEFDIAFEASRKPGDTSEPGDDPSCPVYREHQLATIIEKNLALAMDIDWKAYEQTVNEL